MDNSVFVIFKEEGLGLNEISQKLDLKSDKEVLFEKPGSNSVWKKFCQKEDTHLEEQLEYWARLLRNKSNELQCFKEKGWSVELDCLVQTDDGTALIYLEPETLKRISKLNISLKIRFWESTENDV